jgi:hypothetical protein
VKCRILSILPIGIVLTKTTSCFVVVVVVFVVVVVVIVAFCFLEPTQKDRCCWRIGNNHL